MDVSSEKLGKVVRDAWVDWAKQQPNPKPSWLVPWEELNETDKNADRLIGLSVAEHVLKQILLERETDVEAVREK